MRAIEVVALCFVQETALPKLSPNFKKYFFPLNQLLSPDNNIDRTRNCSEIKRLPHTPLPLACFSTYNSQIQGDAHSSACAGGQQRPLLFKIPRRFEGAQGRHFCESLAKKR